MFSPATLALLAVIIVTLVPFMLIGPLNATLVKLASSNDTVYRHGTTLVDDEVHPVVVELLEVVVVVVVPEMVAVVVVREVVVVVGVPEVVVVTEVVVVVVVPEVVVVTEVVVVVVPD